MHEGHRNRLRARFNSDGFDKFEPHEVLELILYYVIPRMDTNPIAHRLINKFGSLSAVFDAPISLLKEVDGIGESAAFYIKLFPEICRVYLTDKYNDSSKFDLKDCFDKLVLKFVGRQEEVVVLMLLDAKGKILFDGVINTGTVNAVGVYIRKIIELVVLYNAVGVILAHNHPSGITSPSREDLESTKKIESTLSAMKVKLIDHIIVVDGDYISIRELYPSNRVLDKHLQMNHC